MEKKKSEAQERAERKTGKEERAKKRADLERKLLNKMERKHQATLAAIRNYAGDNDEVFAEPARHSGFVLGVENPPAKTCPHF